MKDASSYTYDRFGKTGSRVGQAVQDILSADQTPYRAEEILEEMGKGIAKYISEAADEGAKKYSSPFYILHLFKKELSAFGVSNAMLQKATCFEKRKWTPKEVMEVHPHAAKTLYRVDPKHGTITLEWTVPGKEDCKSILKTPDLYDESLVKWVKEVI